MYVSLSFDRPEEINKSYIYIQCNSPKCIILILLMIMWYMNFPPLFPTFFLCLFLFTCNHLLYCLCWHITASLGMLLPSLDQWNTVQLFYHLRTHVLSTFKKWQIHKTSDALIHFLPFLFGFPTIYTANPAWMCWLLLLLYGLVQVNKDYFKDG